MGSTAIFVQSGGGTIKAWGGIISGAGSGTFAASTSAFTNSGGLLYIGNVGSICISRGAVFAPTNYFVFSGGTVGALQSWISSVPLILDTLNGNITFQCADDFGSPFNISLSGALTGPGGLYKTGGGTLTLSGANNYVGSTVVSNGVLLIKTVNLPTNGSVTLDGTAGSPINTVQTLNAGKYWSIGDLTYAAGSPVADFDFTTATPSSTVAPILVNGNLAFAVTPNVSIEGSAIPVGDYPLIQYTGNISVPPPTTTISLPSGLSATIVNNTGSKTIVLHVSASGVKIPFVWGVGNGVWDINTTPNWLQGGNPIKYSPDDGTADVAFDDTASGASPITVTLNTTVHPRTVTANNLNKSYIISGAGSIDGAAAMVVKGGGTITLSGTILTVAARPLWVAT